MPYADEKTTPSLVDAREYPSYIIEQAYSAKRCTKEIGALTGIIEPAGMVEWPRTLRIDTCQCGLTVYLPADERRSIHTRPVCCLVSLGGSYALTALNPEMTHEERSATIDPIGYGPYP